MVGELLGYKFPFLASRPGLRFIYMVAIIMRSALWKAAIIVFRDVNLALHPQRV